ncbi:MAG: exodeoxyribonuclease VII small subunit [Clostridia bacterium]|nr:exodeoxyribonuclease VII small subunit [Clostridia bacterium]
MNIEKSIEQLNVLAEIVSSDKVALEDALKAFEKGVEIAEETIRQLEEYKVKLIVLQQKVNKLTDEN